MEGSLCLRVSVPRPDHQCADLSCLRTHEEDRNSLPEGWVQYTDSGSSTENVLVFVKLSISFSIPAAEVVFFVKVDQTLNWSLSCQGVQIDVSRCSSLASTPSKLTSFRTIVNLLQSLSDSVKVCQGNAVSDFAQLVEVHGREFMDISGMFIVIMCVDFQRAL